MQLPENNFTYGNKNAYFTRPEKFNKIYEKHPTLATLSKCSELLISNSPATLPNPDLCQSPIWDGYCKMQYLNSIPGRPQFSPWERWEHCPQLGRHGTTSIQEQSHCLVEYPFQRDSYTCISTKDFLPSSPTNQVDEESELEFPTLFACSLPFSVHRFPTLTPNSAPGSGLPTSRQEVKREEICPKGQSSYTPLSSPTLGERALGNIPTVH